MPFNQSIQRNEDRDRILRDVKLFTKHCSGGW